MLSSVKGYGRMITEAREAAGLTKAELALRIDADASLISKLEDEKIGISPAMFIRLTTALRTLVPAKLVSALGYPVTVDGAERLPRALVSQLLTMTPSEHEALLVLLRGSASTPHRRSEIGR